MGIFNNINDLSNKLCVPDKTEDLNSNVSNVITGRNESKISKNMYDANVNVNLTVENITWVKSGTMIMPMIVQKNERT